MNLSLAKAADAKDIALVQELSWLAAYPRETVSALLKQVPLHKRISLWEHRIHGLDCYTVVYKIQAEIVGFCFVKVDYCLKQAELEALYVNPKYWRQGIGSTLVNYCQNREQISFKWRLWVLSENKNALCFYKNLGFSLDERTDTNVIADARYNKLGMTMFKT